MTGRPKISGRATSLAHAFVHAVIPREIDEAEQRRLYAAAGIDPAECVYCGDRATDRDHFRGLVKGGMPSGFYHTPDNLVPSCGPCNQSKGGSEWRSWMRGKAKGSPSTRKVIDLETRIARLEVFESLSSRVAGANAEIRETIGPDLWDAYWDRLKAIRTALTEAEQASDVIRARWEAVARSR